MSKITNTDYTTKIIDGKEEIILTPRGVILMVFYSWHDDKMPKGKLALQKYCEYLALRRYGKSSKEIFRELKSMDKDNGAEWIKATYGMYVSNDADVVNYVMNV